MQLLYFTHFNIKNLEFNSYTAYISVTEDYQMSSENPYFYLWILASIISSCYAYTWDIKMDWGLFDKKAGDNKFLREEIVYSSAVSKFISHDAQTFILQQINVITSEL